jgi:hypothetical protein
MRIEPFEPCVVASASLFRGSLEDVMALRDKMLSSSAQYLHPGETAEAVFGAQTTSQYLFALTGAIGFIIMNSYRIVVVTPQRILVLDAGKMGMGKARGVVTELPRSTRLGPPSGVWHVIPATGEKLRVHRRFFKDLEAADAATPTAAA